MNQKTIIMALCTIIVISLAIFTGQSIKIGQKSSQDANVYYLMGYNWEWWSLLERGSFEEVKNSIPKYEYDWPDFIIAKNLKVTETKRKIVLEFEIVRDGKLPIDPRP